MTGSNHSAGIDIAGGISLEKAEGSNPNDGAIAELTGHWICSRRGCRGTIGYSFTDPDATGDLTYASYGKCHPTWSTQVFPAQATATGFATMVHGGFYRAAIHGVLNHGTLTVKEITMFTDGSGREAQYRETSYARLEGAGMDAAGLQLLERTLVEEFYHPSTPGYVRGDRGGFGAGQIRDSDVPGIPIRNRSAGMDIAGRISLGEAEGGNPNDGAIAGLTGHWICPDRGCRGTIGCSFTDPDATGGLTLASYGKCHPTWSTQVFPAQATANGFGAMVHGGFCRAAMHGVLNQGTLTVKEIKMFIDGSGREAQYHETSYVRLEGAGMDAAGLQSLEKKMVEEFYHPSTPGYIRIDRGGFGAGQIHDSDVPGIPLRG